MPKYYRDQIFSDVEKDRQLHIIHDAMEEAKDEFEKWCVARNLHPGKYAREQKDQRRRRFEKFNSKNRIL